MTYAVISDLHANLPALQEVLKDLESLGIDEVYCLGDVVGYGPDPTACVDLVRQRVHKTVKGNHDEALVHGGYGFHLRAREAIDWTRDELKPGFFSGLTVRQRWDFLTSLPLRFERGKDVFVHGSPRDPTSEYLLAEWLHSRREMFSEAFDATDRLLFTGHTHLPCAVTDTYEVVSSTEGYVFGARGEQRAIVNVGSVGQPRDKDPRACYVVVREEGADLRIEWRRVAYAIEETISRVVAQPRLDNRLGERLRHGA
ncbi:MAG: metallophosphoesterase family protein [Planctomycetes bacterium]|nr:metallophosphoesterase family protein [Planctomycetota bacterium]